MAFFKSQVKGNPIKYREVDEQEYIQSPERDENCDLYDQEGGML
jgi:hypothetical protein